MTVDNWHSAAHWRRTRAHILCNVTTAIHSRIKLVRVASSCLKMSASFKSHFMYLVFLSLYNSEYSRSNNISHQTRMISRQRALTYCHVWLNRLQWKHSTSRKQTNGNQQLHSIVVKDRKCKPEHSSALEWWSYIFLDVAYLYWSIYL